MVMMGCPPAVPELSRKAAIVGVGETDYHADYQAQRAKAADWTAPTPEGLALTALERALADSGLRREDIDGLACAFLYGGPDPAEIARAFGIRPRHTMEVLGLMRGSLPQVCAAIAEGKADTIAVVSAVATRSIGRTFGGNFKASDEGATNTYYYHHPWGWSSQGAHWALCWQYYMTQFGRREEDLGEVALQLRANAMRDPKAVMQAPITIDDYMGARFIVKPLRLLDMCLVNDGAVAFIVTRADRAGAAAPTPVTVAGWASAEVKADKLDSLVRRRLAPQFAEANRQLEEMSGRSLTEVQHFEGYDAASMHLVSQVEGHGFAAPGTALDRWHAGDFAAGGEIGDSGHNA